MKKANVVALCLIAIIVSFLGFVVENIWLSYSRGRIDNRNMCFPFLIGYGIAIILIFIILGTPKKPWLFGFKLNIRNKFMRIFFYFIGVMLCVSLGEIVIGTIVEKTCNFYWWDYSKLPLHITRYTSLPTSIMFSAMIVIFMNNFFIPLFDYFSRISNQTFQTLSIILFCLLIGDFAFNAYKMYKTKSMIIRWRIDTKERKLNKRYNM